MINNEGIDNNPKKMLENAAKNISALEKKIQLV